MRFNLGNKPICELCEKTLDDQRHFLNFYTYYDVVCFDKFQQYNGKISAAAVPKIEPYFTAQCAKCEKTFNPGEMYIQGQNYHVDCMPTLKEQIVSLSPQDQDKIYRFMHDALNCRI